MLESSQIAFDSLFHKLCMLHQSGGFAAELRISLLGVLAPYSSLNAIWIGMDMLLSVASQINIELLFEVLGGAVKNPVFAYASINQFLKTPLNMMIYNDMSNSNNTHQVLKKYCIPVLTRTDAHTIAENLRPWLSLDVLDQFFSDDYSYNKTEAANKIYVACDFLISLLPQLSDDKLTEYNVLIKSLVERGVLNNEFGPKLLQLHIELLLKVEGRNAVKAVLHSLFANKKLVQTDRSDTQNYLILILNFLPLENLREILAYLSNIIFVDFKEYNQFFNELFFKFEPNTLRGVIVPLFDIDSCKPFRLTEIKLASLVLDFDQTLQTSLQKLLGLYKQAGFQQKSGKNYCTTVFQNFFKFLQDIDAHLSKPSNIVIVDKYVKCLSFFDGKVEAIEAPPGVGMETPAAKRQKI
jgi:hypothetical protein